MTEREGTAAVSEERTCTCGHPRSMHGREGCVYPGDIDSGQCWCEGMTEREGTAAVSEDGLNPVDEMTEVLRETMRANDVEFWSASGAHVFNSETALGNVARGLLARRVAEPSRVLAAAPPAPLDVDRLVEAMDAAYEYEPEYVPVLPFRDDVETFWDPYAAKVAREYAALAAEDAP